MKSFEYTMFAVVDREKQIEIIKLNIARAISELINDKKLTEEEAAELLGITIYNLKNNKFDGFSLDRLFKFILLLDYDVTIHINDNS
jgi:predicted XRE-type DNA-binding protein